MPAIPDTTHTITSPITSGTRPTTLGRTPTTSDKIPTVPGTIPTISAAAAMGPSHIHGTTPEEPAKIISSTITAILHPPLKIDAASCIIMQPPTKPVKNKQVLLQRIPEIQMKDVKLWSRF